VDAIIVGHENAGHFGAASYMKRVTRTEG